MVQGMLTIGTIIVLHQNGRYALHHGDSEKNTIAQALPLEIVMEVV